MARACEVDVVYSLGLAGLPLLVKQEKVISLRQVWSRFWGSVLEGVVEAVALLIPAQNIGLVISTQNGLLCR